METSFFTQALTSLQQFINDSQKEISTRYLQQFNSLLTSFLKFNNETMIPLNEEISSIENYLSLQQMQYDGVFNYQLIPPAQSETNQLMIPNKYIIPFVENAIQHGIDLSTGTGEVIIRFSLKPTTIEVEVSDNGKPDDGFSQGNHRSVQQVLGLQNKQKATGLFAKKIQKAVDIQYFNNHNGGTTVSIVMPVIAQ